MYIARRVSFQVYDTTREDMRRDARTCIHSRYRHYVCDVRQYLPRPRRQWSFNDSKTRATMPRVLTLMVERSIIGKARVQKKKMNYRFAFHLKIIRRYFDQRAVFLFPYFNNILYFTTNREEGIYQSIIIYRYFLISRAHTRCSIDVQ